MTVDRQLVRWRLVLGEESQLGLGSPSLGGDGEARDAALSWLYDREGDRSKRGIRDRQGGSEDSQLSVPEWLDAVTRLFPKETIERLEQDAVDRYGISEIVTNPDVLRRVEPSETLLKAVLHTKHLMNPEVLAMARELVAKVVRQLIERMTMEVRRAFTGAKERRRSIHPNARNFDAKRTIRANLRHWSVEERRLFIQKPQFFSRSKTNRTKWQLVLLVDESGSMLDSVMHAAVTAACLWGLPSLKTHLCIFDTKVVDLTEHVTDPVEVLMKVQLGGGTDIAQAVRYAAGLVENPRQTIVVLITDFFEGGDARDLVHQVKLLCEQGSTVLGLAALDQDANPTYDRDLARRLVQVGAHVGAMTPGELAAWIAEKVGK